MLRSRQPGRQLRLVSRRFGEGCCETAQQGSTSTEHKKAVRALGDVLGGSGVFRNSEPVDARDKRLRRTSYVEVTQVGRLLPGQRRQKVTLRAGHANSRSMARETGPWKTKAAIKKPVTKAHRRRTAPRWVASGFDDNKNPTNYQTEFDKVMVQAIQVQADSDNARTRSIVKFGA